MAVGSGGKVVVIVGIVVVEFVVPCFVQFVVPSVVWFVCSVAVLAWRGVFEVSGL